MTRGLAASESAISYGSFLLFLSVVFLVFDLAFRLVAQVLSGFPYELWIIFHAFSPVWDSEGFRCQSSSTNLTDYIQPRLHNIACISWINAATVQRGINILLSDTRCMRCSFDVERLRQENRDSIMNGMRMRKVVIVKRRVSAI